MLVEDETSIADLERLYLTQAGYTVHTERDGRAALAQIQRLRPAVVILDIGLPGLDGVGVCRALREAGDWTPVVFVTARDDEVDRVLGLELGADDYITNPFSPRELVARVKGILRRSAGPPGSSLRVAGIVLDQERRTATSDGVPVDLTATEFDLLAKLMTQPGRVFTREQLLSSVWGVADYSSSRTVDVHIAQLRGKLGTDCPIRTVRRVGYSIEDR